MPAAIGADPSRWPLTSDSPRSPLGHPRPARAVEQVEVRTPYRHRMRASDLRPILGRHPGSDRLSADLQVNVRVLADHLDPLDHACRAGAADLDRAGSKADQQIWAAEPPVPARTG